MKRKNSILIPVVLVVAHALATNGWAQGHFVRHGFQVSMPEVAIGSGNSLLVFRAGYHIYGLAELGLALERRSDFDDDIVSVSLTPTVAVYPVRQSAVVPFTLRLGGAYETLSLSGDPITTLEESGVLSKGRAWRWQGGISRRIPFVGTLLGFPVTLIPVIDFSYRSVTVDQGSETRQDGLSTMDIQALFVIDVGGMAHVVAGPRIGVFDDAFAGGFTLGLTAGYGY